MHTGTQRWICCIKAMKHTHTHTDTHTHTLERESQADNGQWNCAIREGCCPVTGQLGQQMVIFPSTNTSRREGGEWRRGMRGMRGEAQQFGLDLQVNAFHKVHGNDSAITHKANELNTDSLRVCTELRRRNGKFTGPRCTERLPKRGLLFLLPVAFELGSESQPDKHG